MTGALFEKHEEVGYCCRQLLFTSDAPKKRVERRDGRSKAELPHGDLGGSDSGEEIK